MIPSITCHKASPDTVWCTGWYRCSCNAPVQSSAFKSKVFKMREPNSQTWSYGLAWAWLLHMLQIL